MGGTVSKITSNEGFFALWKGVNAAWLREASYTSLRLGLYEPVKVAFGANDPATTTFLKKFAAGSAAGAIGSLAGNPFDVLKTKMMTSAGKEVSNYLLTLEFNVAKLQLASQLFLPFLVHSRFHPSPRLPKNSSPNRELEDSTVVSTPTLPVPWF